MENRIRVAVLIIEDEKVLLVKHSNPDNGKTSWVPPGGGLQDEETLFECAKREVFEETNLDVEISKIVYIRQFIDYYSMRNNLEIFTLAKAHKGVRSIANLKGMGGDEHFIRELEFLSKDEMKKIKVFPKILYDEFWDDLKKGFPDIRFLEVQENKDERREVIKKGETRFATKAVIFKDDKVLVLARASKDGFRPGEDDFPGGKIEFGEEPDNGLLREIKEESGLDVRIIGPVRCWSFVKKKENWQLFGVSYLCEWKKGNVKLSEEHDSFSWKTPAQIMKSKCRKWMKDDLKAALELRKKER